MSGRKTTVLLIVVVCICSLALSVNAVPRVPTLDDLLTLKTVGVAQISPDGKWIAYTVGYGDFKTDSFINHIWLVSTDTGKSFQLTRGDKSSGTPRWSPDGQWLAFLSS